jgi:CheY-like chemotaxis protein/anti-sigma regulatory factor (Ser/Thr protein kinase)
VQADEGQLVQVLTNILVNAADSIADGRASANRIRLVTATDDTGRAVIEISDTGCGIAAANLSRIFDPFFSTKPSGEGMGLGLSICFGIVRGFGGDIHVESEIGKGTLFRVTLPGAERPSEKAPTAKPVSDTAPRRGRVLVIDDDLGVGRMIERILRDGYDVTTESEPKLAIERVAQGEAFDVILCDVMMPDLTGPEVHAAIMNVRPELASRIVFLTGGAFSPRASHFLEHVASATLAKPFAVDALRTLVSEYVSKP